MSRYQDSGPQPTPGTRGPRPGRREGSPAWSAAWTAAATSCAVSASMTMFRRSSTWRTTCPAYGSVPGGPVAAGLRARPGLCRSRRRSIGDAGPGRALELVLTARPVAAEEAAAIGLVEVVLPDDGFLEAAIDWARGIASQPRSALVAAKRAVIDGLRLPLSEGLRLEAQLFAEFLADPATLALQDRIRERYWGRRTCRCDSDVPGEVAVQDRGTRGGPRPVGVRLDGGRRRAQRRSRRSAGASRRRDESSRSSGTACG